MRMYEDYLPPVASRKKRDPEPEAQPHAVTKPSWQAVGLPGSDGWLSRMQQHGPDGRAEVMSELQQTTGNRNVSRALARTTTWASFWDTVSDVGSQLIDEAMCFTLSGTVGAGAKNEPADVKRVRARLHSLGYPTTDGGDSLAQAIKDYQRDVVGLKKPDGRIDPGGKTLAKLNEGAAKPATTAAPTTTPTSTTAPGTTTAPATATTPTAPATTPAPTSTTATTPAATTAGAPGPPANLDALVARSPQLKDAIDALGKMSKLATTTSEAALKADKTEKGRYKEDAERTHGQEGGAERDALVVEIKKVRAKIDGLNETSGLSGKDLSDAKAYLYRELAKASPYYYQIVNANILEKGGKAGGRTCNVTSLSMTLEAFGKSAADYTGPEWPVLPLIAVVIPERMATARDKVPTARELEGLRLPDFLQLVAISKFLPKTATPELAHSDPEAFAKEVEKARKEAAAHITLSGWFDTLMDGFGVDTDNEFPFAGMTVGTGDNKIGYATALERVGEINRSSIGSAMDAIVAKKNKEEYEKALKAAQEKAAAEGKTLAKNAKIKQAKTWKRADLTAEEQAEATRGALDYFNTQRPGKQAEWEKRKGEVEEALKTASAADKKALKKELAELKSNIAEAQADRKLTALGVHNASVNPRELDKILPIDEYARVVSASLNKYLDAGHQVVGHMHGHFFRVESVSSTGIMIDDPGGWTGRSRLLAWDEARAKGSFSRFTWVKKR